MKTPAGKLVIGKRSHRHVLACSCGSLSDEIAMAKVISSRGNCDLTDDPHHDLFEDFYFDNIMSRASKREFSSLYAAPPPSKFTRNTSGRNIGSSTFYGAHKAGDKANEERLQNLLLIRIGFFFKIRKG